MGIGKMPLDRDAAPAQPAPPIDHWHGVGQARRGDPWWATCSCGWRGPARVAWTDANTDGAVHVWNARQGIA